jgi:hypothetical protein
LQAPSDKIKYILQSLLHMGSFIYIIGIHQPYQTQAQHQHYRRNDPDGLPAWGIEELSGLT